MAKERPYDEATGDEICARLASSEKGLNSICKEIGIAPSTVYKWLALNKSFAEQYARAREIQADYMAESILDIADDSSNDTIITEDGEMPNKEWMNRSRLRVDTRKWLMSKLHAKKYGDKLDLNVTEIPAPIIELSPDGEAETKP